MGVAVRTTTIRRVAGFVFAVLLAVPALAGAESDPDRSALSDAEKERLNKLIEDARGDYQAERYEASIDKLKEAYNLYPNPAFFYRIGLAYQKADQPESALEYFRRYLDEKPESPKREEVEGRIASLEELLDDAETEEPAEDSESEAADETETAETSGEGDESEKTTSASDGETDVASTSAGGGDRSGGGPGPGPWIAGGVGGAATITGITFGILSVTAKQRVDSVTKNDELTREEARNRGLIQRPRRYGTIALVSGGVAVAALGTAGILLATGNQDQQASRKRVPVGAKPVVGIAPVREGEGALLRLDFDF